MYTTWVSPPSRRFTRRPQSYQKSSTTTLVQSAQKCSTTPLTWICTWPSVTVGRAGQRFRGKAMSYVSSTAQNRAASTVEIVTKSLDSSSSHSTNTWNRSVDCRSLGSLGLSFFSLWFYLRQSYFVTEFTGPSAAIIRLYEEKRVRKPRGPTCNQNHKPFNTRLSC